MNFQLLLVEDLKLYTKLRRCLVNALAARHHPHGPHRFASLKGVAIREERLSTWFQVLQVQFHHFFAFRIWISHWRETCNPRKKTSGKVLEANLDSKGQGRGEGKGSQSSLLMWIWLFTLTYIPVSKAWSENYSQAQSSSGYFSCQYDSLYGIKGINLEHWPHMCKGQNILALSFE